MQYQVFKTYDELSEQTAQTVIELIKEKPNATICVASGETPLLSFKKIVEKSSELDLSQVTFVALDEWVGIDRSNSGSCGYFIEQNLIKPLGLEAHQIHYFDGMSADLDSECAKMDEFVATHGGLDLIVVGVGINGHIGLNEPGSSFDLYAHVSQLAQMTIDVGQKYFSSTTALTQGITIGLKHVLEAKKAILIANGPKKGPIIQQLLASEISEDLPATVFKKHHNGLVWVDEALATSITQ
jgi:galactosamine-6-phosphate isomerase